MEILINRLYELNIQGYTREQKYYYIEKLENDSYKVRYFNRESDGSIYFNFHDGNFISKDQFERCTLVPENMEQSFYQLIISKVFNVQSRGSVYGQS